MLTVNKQVTVTVKHADRFVGCNVSQAEQMLSSDPRMVLTRPGKGHQSASSRLVASGAGAVTV